MGPAPTHWPIAFSSVVGTFFTATWPQLRPKVCPPPCPRLPFGGLGVALDSTAWRQSEIAHLPPGAPRGRSDQVRSPPGWSHAGTASTITSARSKAPHAIPGAIRMQTPLDSASTRASLSRPTARSSPSSPLGAVSPNTRPPGRPPAAATHISHPDHALAHDVPTNRICSTLLRHAFTAKLPAARLSTTW